MKDFEKMKSNITHIITVTCTGLFAPGLEIELIRELGLRPETERAPVNFMGCNAAMLALKQADYICKSYLNALVLIVCTEICTIHFQRDFSDDYIISNLTFGDGSSAALVAAEKKIPGTQFKPVKLRFFQSQVVYKGYDEMNWRITEKGFIMKLGSSVPDYLSENIGELLSSSGIQKKDIKHWAIHPGGKRVLECFASAMKLEKEDLSSSYHVLENYGNMSSVTIMFVLKHLLENDNVSDKDSIFAAAFGPGLTIEAAVMDYV
jgi:predicted naringenin-chalcone synthase